MAQEVRSLTETLAALSTVERLLSRVRPLVGQEVGPLAEGFAALGTRIRPVP